MANEQWPSARLRSELDDAKWLIERALDLIEEVKDKAPAYWQDKADAFDRRAETFLAKNG